MTPSARITFALLAGLISAGCTPRVVKLAEQGRLVAACREQPLFTSYERASWRVSDAIVARTDVRLRYAPLTAAEVDAMAGQALGERNEELVRLVRLDLEVRKLAPGVGVRVELPKVYRGHSYLPGPVTWSSDSVNALLPAAPRLTLPELPVYRAQKPPPEPGGTNYALTRLTLGLIKTRARRPSRRELRQWRAAMKAYKAAELERRAAFDQELAQVTKQRDELTAEHRRRTAARQALVSRLKRGLAGGCSQLDGEQLRFGAAGRCVLHLPLVLERAKYLRNGLIPARASLHVDVHFELSDGDGRCSYKRTFQLELDADERLGLSRAFKGGPIRLQDLPRDTSLAD